MIPANLFSGVQPSATLPLYRHFIPPQGGTTNARSTAFRRKAMPSGIPRREITQMRICSARIHSVACNLPPNCHSIGTSFRLKAELQTLVVPPLGGSRCSAVFSDERLPKCEYDPREFIQWCATFRQIATLSALHSASRRDYKRSEYRLQAEADAPITALELFVWAVAWESSATGRRVASDCYCCYWRLAY